MKVLFWMSTSFQTTSRHLLISILEELQMAGHQVTILNKSVDSETEQLPKELARKGLECISVPVKAANKSNLVARYIKDIVYLIKCRKHLKTAYDAVFVQSTNIAGLAIYLLQKKQPNAIKTINVQDAFPDNAAFSGAIRKNGLLYQMLRKTQGYAYRKADHIITISEDIKELVQEYGISSRKIDVVYNWSYQDELYSKDTVDVNAVSYIFDPSKYHVVYAGNIGLMQGVDSLVDAAREMEDDTDICFDIIGNGLYKEKLQKRVSELGLKNVFFYPMQPADLAPAVYCSANINVIPLKGEIFKTALPSKTATCLACQQPIIFAIGKDSKFGKWISAETGCPVVAADNLNDFVDAIRSIKRSSINCNTGETYRKYFSKKKNSRRYVELITKK